MNQSLTHETTAETYIEIEPRAVLARLISFARAHAATLLAATLLAIMALQMFVVIRRKSITIDEVVMIPSAYYHLAAGDHHLINEHPPLSKIIAAVPLLFLQPQEISAEQTVQLSAREAKWAPLEKFWQNNSGEFNALSFWPRAAMIFLTIGLGVLVFRFSRTLFNERVAVIAVGLLALEPTVLGHGRVVQTDVPAAFGYLLFFGALYYYTRQESWPRAALLGVAAGIAVLSKYSMLLVGLVLAPFFIVSWWRAQSSARRGVLARATIAFVAVLVVINAAYAFSHPSLSDTDLQWIQTSFISHPRAVENVTRTFSWILPKDFILGIFFQFVHNHNGHFASLLGMYSQTGWWYYYPVAFALKSTLPFLLLSLASSAWAVYQVIRKKDRRFLWLLVPLGLYTVFVMFSHINIGIRYYLPAYPFLFMLAAALLDRLLKSNVGRRAGALVAVALLTWIAVEAVRAFPNHLPYMNQLASRAPHWWYLSDSNVEWGDDLRSLATYLQERGESRVTDATLGGWFTLGFYGIERVNALAGPPPADPPRYIAVGASYLNGSTLPAIIRDGRVLTEPERINFFSEYRYRTPEAVFGGSVYLFRQTDH